MTFNEIISKEKIIMTFYVTNVASNSLFRDIEVRFFCEDAQTFIDVSEILANELDMKFKNGGVRIPGVGMNMAFALSELIKKHSDEKHGKTIQIENHIFTRKERDLHIEFMLNFKKPSQTKTIKTTLKKDSVENMVRTLKNIPKGLAKMELKILMEGQETIDPLYSEVEKTYKINSLGFSFIVLYSGEVLVSKTVK